MKRMKSAKRERRKPKQSPVPNGTLMRAKVFMTGRSQAIRLPKEFRVDTEEVHLKRTEEGFVVTTRDPWELFHEGVNQLSPGVLEERPPQPPMQERDWGSA